MGNQLTVPSGSSWYLEDFNSNNLKNPKSIFDGTFNLSFRAEENQGYVAVKAVQLSGKDDRSIAQTFFNIYKDKSSLISPTKSGNLISVPILTKNGAYLKRPFIDMPLTERIDIDPPLEYFEKKWTAYQLLHAIRNLHKITIFHGDIKPENVLVTPNLNVYLTDHAPFKPQYLSQNQPHYFIHFFSYGRPSAYIAPERISSDLSMDPERQQEQTNRARLAIEAITASLCHNKVNKTVDQAANDTNNIEKADTTFSEETESTAETEQTVSTTTDDDQDSQQATDALCAMQAADLFSIGCVLAFLFTGESLFDFSSIVQYGHHNDNTPLKHLEKITDLKMKELILKLIDREQKVRIDAINHFEESFPQWMNDFYCFYIENIIGAPVNTVPFILSSKTLRNIFSNEDIKDDIIIYLNILMEFFSYPMEISKLTFIIQLMEHYSLKVESARLKVVRLLPPLLFLFYHRSPPISAVALDAMLTIIRSIDSIENEPDIVKAFADVFFVPHLLIFMDESNGFGINQQAFVISRIPVIFVEFGRLWPSVLEKIPNRFEFTRPMLQRPDQPIDPNKMTILRYFLSSGRSVTYTKNYLVFKALSFMLFQMLNCTDYVPLIVEFVMAFLNELGHSDKIRFYSELFAPIQGTLLSYVSNFSKSSNSDHIVVIFDAFATMIDEGEIKMTYLSAIANAVYKHISSTHPSSRITSHVLLKKLPKFYHEFDLLPLSLPQSISQSNSATQMGNITLPQQKMTSFQHSQTVLISPNLQVVPRNTNQKSSKANRNSTYVQSGQKKKGKKVANIQPVDDQLIEGENSENEASTSTSTGQTQNSQQANETMNSTASVNSFNSVQNSISSVSVDLDSNIGIQKQSEMSRSTAQFRPTQNLQIKSQLYSSTKISSSPIEKIITLSDRSDDYLDCVVHHSQSTVVCYHINTNPNNRNNCSSFDQQMIEQSWIYNFPEPIVNIDLFNDAQNNDRGLIITLPTSVITRTNRDTKTIYQAKKPFEMCKMVNGTTMAVLVNSQVVCCDIFNNFAMKSSYKIERNVEIKDIYRWESMDDNLFAFSSSNGRLYAIDQRANVPIFSTAEYRGLSHVVLLPHLAYAIVRGCADLSMYKYSPAFENPELKIMSASGGYSPKPIYNIKGSIDAVMPINSSIILMNQYGTFMLDNQGICLSLDDNKRSKVLKQSNDSYFRLVNNSQEVDNLSSISKNRSYSVQDLNQMSVSQQPIPPLSTTSITRNEHLPVDYDGQFSTPVVELPEIDHSTLHGHTFPITACTNCMEGAICLSGDSAGYLNIWSAIRPKYEIV